MADKKQIVREAIKVFEHSDKLANDYLTMLVAITGTVRQGSGLVWTEIHEEINKTLTELYC